MNFQTLIHKLEAALQSPLPGKEAQLHMSPRPVDVRRFDPVPPDTHRKSAVLLLFYPEGEDTFFPLIKRPEYPGFHSGQVAFPGGKMEKEDQSIVHTALRETEEEVGVDRQKVQLLGSLSDLYIPTSNFLVSPVVGFVSEKPRFVPEQKEVTRIIPTELRYLQRPDIRKRKFLALGQNLNLDTPYFEIDGEMVWGATAMILSELIEVIRRTEG